MCVRGVAEIMTGLTGEQTLPAISTVASMSVLLVAHRAAVRRESVTYTECTMARHTHTSKPEFSRRDGGVSFSTWAVRIFLVLTSMRVLGTSAKSRRIMLIRGRRGDTVDWVRCYGMWLFMLHVPPAVSAGGSPLVNAPVLPMALVNSRRLIG